MASDRRRARSLGVAVALFIATASLGAAADPTASDRETARSLMEDGDAKREKNDYRGALKSYEAADAIMKVPTTGFELGRAQAQLGMLLEAKETLTRVAKSPARPNEPAPFEKARKAAEQLLVEVAARIPSVTVAVTGLEPGQTAQLQFDGEPVPPAAATAPRKVNPGQHVVLARVGANEKKEELVVAEREQKTVTIDLSAPPKPKEPPLETRPREEPQPPPSGASGGGPAKVLTYGGFALAVVGGGVGTVTGLMSMSQVSDIKKSCTDNHCPPEKRGDIDSAKTLGTVSTIAFVAGGVGVAVGIVGIILTGRETRVEASVGPSWAGLSGVF